jgi:hypothetical protein
MNSITSRVPALSESWIAAWMSARSPSLPTMSFMRTSPSPAVMGPVIARTPICESAVALISSKVPVLKVHA